MSGCDQVVIVGGGPAGLAASLALRLRGFPVTVVDGANPPVDKACGEGLLPETLSALEALGVPQGGLRGAPLRGVRYVAGKQSVEASFPARQALGIRRTALHETLCAAAASSGVVLPWNEPALGLEPQGVRLRSGLLPARFVVGADGQYSRVRRWAGLERAVRPPRRYAFRRHFVVAPWSDFLEVHWKTGAQAYVTPVGKREVCLAILSCDPHLRLREALEGFPAIAPRLLGAPALDSERGAATVTRVWPCVTRGNVALIGDASGTVDAITGEGLGLAFRQAGELAEALAQGRLEPYERAHRRLRRKPRIMAALLLGMARSAALERRAMTALAGRPQLFGKLLALHASSRFRLDDAGAGLELAWSLLQAPQCG